MDDSKKIELYAQMSLIRRFEERAAQAYTQGKIGGYLHLYIGQEAVVAGFLAYLRDDDCVADSYRDHGHALARGLDPKRCMAELFGKSTGVSHGKGGSMHLFSRERNFLGGTGIVAAGIPIATGAAFAIKYRGGDQVCLCFFGDGAVNEGAFHESLNLAALWDLPVIYVCENNGYAMGTSVERSSSLVNLVDRVAGYDMPREQVDGMDLHAVLHCAKRAVAEARKTQKPRFVEALTYRYRGHGAADPATYRTKEEVEEWRARDPIALWEARLKKEGILTDEKAQEIQEQARARALEAVQFADESPPPPAEALFEDVYAPTGAGG